MIKEQQIQKACLEYLNYKGHFVWKQNNTGILKPDGKYIPSGLKGVSDILGISKDGKFLAIEIKSEKGILSNYQEIFLKEIKNRGGIALVARSIKDLELANL
jgi:hypothetical protein